ncbi:beta-glucosidase/glycosyl hydrolase family 16/cell wall glucanase [Blumeria hordei DH14]|uniref:Crh-like protein n=1 Tax=Blumeria graminis f. sp. hordei (strain DH14) TaxID=546991 RepID=N1JCV7_BLUG1|nr:beta-glucosidase/glycosyl hydrolase family 16/cell wall glucanase [Blumeria hordei DH14]
MRTLLLLFGVLVIHPLAQAQTWTECNPMEKTCPNNPAFGTSRNFIFNTSSTVTNSFNITAGALKYGTGNAAFTVSKRGDSPTIQSKFYIMFGSVSVIMKAASGQGIISSIVLQSEDLDEIDWEFLGGNNTHVETNYFGKGNITSFDRAVYHPVSFDPQADFHNYSIHWTSEKLEWWIDSNLIRTLPYAEANGGHNYPQTPATVRLGIWPGGDKANNAGTIDWAGGLTDFSKGPFTMEIQSAQITDFGSGKEYEWTDRSGSWESIKAVPGNSTALKVLLKADEPPPPTVAERFAALPSGTKLAIYCGGGGIMALLLSIAFFTCHRSRRRGRLEREAYDAKMEKERDEIQKDLMEIRAKGFTSRVTGTIQKEESELEKFESTSEYGASPPHASTIQTHPQISISNYDMSTGNPSPEPENTNNSIVQNKSNKQRFPLEV